MENKSIIIALCRCAIATDSSAVRQQVKRLAKKLKQDNDADAHEIEELLILKSPIPENQIPYNGIHQQIESCQPIDNTVIKPPK